MPPSFGELNILKDLCCWQLSAKAPPTARTDAGTCGTPAEEVRTASAIRQKLDLEEDTKYEIIIYNAAAPT